jgi:tetratricopeptide (TPR) repeat protein
MLSNPKYKLNLFQIMKLNRIFLGVLALMFLLEQAYAQPIGNKPTLEMKHDIGDQQSDKKDAYTALEWYISAYDHDNTDASAVYKIASTHEALRDYKSAAEWYQKLVDLDKDHNYPLSRYQHANAMKMTGDYQNSIIEFNAFMEEYPQDAAKYDYLIKMAKIHCWCKICPK